MHKHFYSFEADDYYNMGLKMGQKFKREVQSRIKKENEDKGFKERIEVARKMLDLTKSQFPNYIEELKGYADGANVDFQELWTLAIEDDAYIKKAKPARCTTLITNDGKLLAHSEDWTKDSAKDISIVKKTIGGLTTLQIYYMCTLGGVSVGVNSNGFAVAVNTLFDTPEQIGIPKSIQARVFLDTGNPNQDFEKVKKLQLADGYSHNIINTRGEILNIEFSTKEASLNCQKSPYAHSNHCLAINKGVKPKDDYGTLSRLAEGQKKISSRNTISEIKGILENNSLGPDKSINNERSIGRMIVDLENLKAYIWLLRENKLGWVEYSLDFIKK